MKREELNVFHFLITSFFLLWIALAIGYLDLGSKTTNFFHKYFASRVAVIFTFSYYINDKCEDRDMRLLISAAVAILYCIIIEI